MAAFTTHDNDRSMRLSKYWLVLCLAIISASAHALPDFKRFSGVEKKQAFFDFLRPLVETENRKLLEQRVLLNVLAKQPELTPVDLKWVTDLSGRYSAPFIDDSRPDFDKLLRRVNTVPVDLALTQAAIESGWGTSRFARLGNNLYGHWCYKAGCGIVPLRRAKGAKHEVRRFDTAQESVRAYLFNLNTHRAYQKLRAKRRALVKAGKPVTGAALAVSLDQYSERGEAYVRDLLRFINTNQTLMQEPAK